MLEATESGIGTELIQREIAIVLYNEINDELDVQQAKWATRDDDWTELTGQNSDEIILEHVEAQNFHQGHRPSLILQDTPKDAYPNISVMAYQGRPTSDILDQATNYNIIVDIEIMVKSENSEAEVDKRIQRTTEATHQVLTRNERLNGVSLGWDNDPVIQITDIFTRREQVSHGDTWYWQGSRLRYSLTRHATLPL